MGREHTVQLLLTRECLSSCLSSCQSSCQSSGVPWGSKKSAAGGSAQHVPRLGTGRRCWARACGDGFSRSQCRRHSVARGGTIGCARLFSSAIGGQRGRRSGGEVVL